jgi:hypothetical protein
MSKRFLPVVVACAFSLLASAAFAQAGASATQPSSVDRALPVPSPAEAGHDPSGSAAIDPLLPSFEWLAISSCCLKRLNNCADLCYPCDPHLSCTDLPSGGCSSSCTCSHLGCPVGGGL